MRRLAAFCVMILLSAGWARAEDVLVELRKTDPSIVIELKYATIDNFMEQVLYPDARCFLRPKTAERLGRVNQALQGRGLRIKIFDGYRPLSVQKKMFKRFPQPGYVMDPKKGSNHNRGAAVDVTLIDADGKELKMPSRYDEFSERSHLDYAGGTPEQTENRRILQEAMQAEGFKPISTEWWHFDDPDAKSYGVLDLPIESLPR